jgi:hypothetical protein
MSASAITPMANATKANPAAAPTSIASHGEEAPARRAARLPPASTATSGTSRKAK